MNAKTIIAAGVSSLAAWTVMAGPTVGIGIRIGAPPPPVVVEPAPVVVAPAPPVVVEVGVPDFYVWDGVEFVGVIGSTYYYLGPGDVWVVMDAPRLARFHTWESAHADWQAHATANVKYRNDAHGHFVPMRSNNGPANRDIDRDKDRDRH